MQARPRALPTRKVFYDWDESTKSDPRLGTAFASTHPGSSFDDDDVPTLPRWTLPTLGLLVVGFFVGRWWSTRKVKSSPTVVAGYGLEMLGCE